MFGTVLFFALAVPFFFVPVALFVVGVDYLALVFEDRGLHTAMSQFQWLWTHRQRLWTEIYQPIIVRALCWFGTASASTLVYTMWRHIGL